VAAVGRDTGSEFEFPHDSDTKQYVSAHAILNRLGGSAAVPIATLTTHSGLQASSFRLRYRGTLRC